MKRQKTLASAISFEKYRKPTRRELFLAEMEQRVPWKELCALLEPFSPKAEGMSSHRVGENAPDSLSTELVQPQRQGRGRDPSATWNPCGASPVSTSTTNPLRATPPPHHGERFSPVHRGVVSLKNATRVKKGSRDGENHSFPLPWVRETWSLGGISPFRSAVDIFREACSGFP
jgi:hypothetical protein